MEKTKEYRLVINLVGQRKQYCEVLHFTERATAQNGQVDLERQLQSGAEIVKIVGDQGEPVLFRRECFLSSSLDEFDAGPQQMVDVYAMQMREDLW